MPTTCPGFPPSPPFSNARGADPAKDSDVNPSTGRTATVTLVSGIDDLTWDLGVYQVASLGDRVWSDTNANGIQDDGESGIVGVRVDLFTGANAPGWYANSGATIASGTSFAAPAIAGAAASVLDGFRSIGWYQDARTLRLNLLLMGDAGSFWGDSLSGIGTSWGAGRMHAAVPYSGWETAPYWWGQSPFALQPGVTAWGCINGCNTMPSSVRQYNWVM